MDINVRQLANITGITSASIRRYADLGLIGEKIEDDIIFSHADIHSLKIFKLALSCGYSIQDVIDIVQSKNRYDSEALKRALERLRSRKTCNEADTLACNVNALGKLEKELEAFINTP